MGTLKIADVQDKLNYRREGFRKATDPGAEGGDLGKGARISRSTG